MDKEIKALTNIHFSSKSEEWATPQYLFNMLDMEFHFTLDPAATMLNAKTPRYYSKAQNGLLQDWSQERVFCNPPYGRVIKYWVEKMATCRAVVCVGLLPARTDTIWFHEYILGIAEIRLLKGRLKFGDAINSAPFPSMICIWRNKL